MQEKEIVTLKDTLVIGGKEYEFVFTRPKVILIEKQLNVKFLQELIDASGGAMSLSVLDAMFVTTIVADNSKKEALLSKAYEEHGYSGLLVFLVEAATKQLGFMFR